MDRARTLMIGGLLATLTACGGAAGLDAGTGPKLSDAGFSATVSGGMSASHSGAAIYLVSPGSGASGAFGMTLSDPKTAASFVITRLGGSVPAVGTYPVANAVDFPFEAQTLVSVGYTVPGVPSRIFSSTGGSFTVTSIAGNRVKGTFSFTARDVACGCDAPATITVTGSFDAAG